MKALTVWQPYASLIIQGCKLFETRSRKTNYRGKIAIHAAKRPCINFSHIHPEIDNAIITAFNTVPLSIKPRYAGEFYEHQLPLGAILGTADIIECWLIENLGFKEDKRFANILSVSDNVRHGQIFEPELFFGEYIPGWYAWELENIEIFPEPIKIKGQQGLWNWRSS